MAGQGFLCRAELGVDGGGEGPAGEAMTFAFPGIGEVPRAIPGDPPRRGD